MTQISKHIVITGASSGIGSALALQYAKAGILLSLTGRNEQRLNMIAEQCRAKGAQIQEKIIDVRDSQMMENWLLEIDNQNSVDLIIANAGISAGTGDTGRPESFEQIKDVFDVNLNGVINTIHPLMDRMISRHRGQIALMSSLASFRGWPGAPAYCASKAAVKVYGESLRNVLARHNVKINVICPGFVKSAMTDANDFPMPFLISSQKAAGIIIKKLDKNKSRICFPLATTFFAWLFSAIPDKIGHILLSRSPNKKASP